MNQPLFISICLTSQISFTSGLKVLMGFGKVRIESSFLIILVKYNIDISRVEM